MMIQLQAESLVEVYKNRGKINRYSRVFSCSFGTTVAEEIQSSLGC